MQRTPRRPALPLAAGALAMMSCDVARGGLIMTAGSTSWDGSCGTSNWLTVCGGGTMTNWNDDNIPTTNSTVSIPNGSPVVAITGNAAAGQINCETGLAISRGGSLQLANGGTIRGLNMNTTSPFGLRLDAGVTTLAGGASWEFGRITGAGTLENHALVNGRTLVLEDSTQFKNFDVLQTAFITMEAGCSFTNAGGGLVAMSVPISLTQTYINGAGTFHNSGDLQFNYDGSPTVIDLGCTYQQLDGATLTVNGTSQGAGTRMECDATFSGGTISLLNGGTLRFRNDNPNATYIFNGLSTISGQGTMFIEMAGTVGSDDFRIDSDLTVNLNDLIGLTMSSGEPLTLNAVLTNQGKMTWSGGTIRAGDCGACEPELRNHGTLDIFTSGASLHTWLHNMSGGTVLHEFGSLSLGDTGVITNLGTYDHRGGTIQLVAGTGNGSFTNYNLYLRPNDPQTIDASIHVPFTLNPGSLAKYEKATTTYLTKGLFFNGGDAEVMMPAIVRVGVGMVESNESSVTGSGEFHIGGVGGVTDFNVSLASYQFPIHLGNPGSLMGASTTGMYLDPGGRISGPGEVINEGRCFWAGGAVGNDGQGRLTNWGDVFLTGGQVGGASAVFLNEFGDDEEFGLVRQTGTLTISGALVHNRGEWRIAASTTIQGFGSHEFFNDQGLFISDPGPTGQVTVSSAFNNAGEVVVNSGTLAFTGPVAQISMGGLGGKWTIVSGATLDLPGSFSVIKPDGRVVAHGSLADLNLVQTNQGAMFLGRGGLANPFLNSKLLSLQPPAGGEPVRVQNGAGSATNGPQGAIEQKTSGNLAGGGETPTALQCVNFTNAGTVRPGGYNAAGPFKIDANYLSQSTAVLEIELAGATPITQHDQLIVDGNVTLNGTLNVKALLGFTPFVGQQFTILAATNGTITGQFSAVTGSGQYGVAYSPGGVTITVLVAPRTGDITGDGQVNTDDLISLIVGWGLCPNQPAPCPADLNGNGSVNTDDLLVLITNWG